MDTPVSHRMSPFGAYLFRQFAQTARQDHQDATRAHAERMTARYPDSHVHECANGCGNAFFCRQPKDECAISPSWTCPRCDDEQQDAYFTTQEPR